MNEVEELDVCIHNASLFNAGQRFASTGVGSSPAPVSKDLLWSQRWRNTPNFAQPSAGSIVRPAYDVNYQQEYSETYSSL